MTWVEAARRVSGLLCIINTIGGNTLHMIFISVYMFAVVCE